MKVLFFPLTLVTENVSMLDDAVQRVDGRDGVGEDERGADKVVDVEHLA